jgi:hypothetical protein
MKNIYEILDEFDLAKNKKERMDVIERNLSQVLVNVLLFTYHPDYQWMVTEIPHSYKFPDLLPGMSFQQLAGNLRKLYLFRKGDPTAERLHPQKRTELLLSMLESMERREAEVIMGIFKKDLGVRGLDYKFVKEAFPNLLP